MTTINANDDATQTIARMRGHVASLALNFGERSTEYILAVGSLNRVIAGLFGWRKVNLWRDGELSVCGIADGITFGLIFHATRRGCKNDGCKAVINDDGHAWVYMPTERMCDAHDPTYPLDCPAPGTWSFHS